MPATVRGKTNVLAQQKRFVDLSFLGRFLPVCAFLLFIVVVVVAAVFQRYIVGLPIIAFGCIASS